jgi:prolyl-tRNA synthetase
MVLTNTDSGENDVLYCDSCSYAANSNHAVSRMLPVNTDSGFTKAEKIYTPATKTIEQLAEFLKVVPSIILKTLVYIADSKPVFVLIRGDMAVEEIKLLNSLNANEIRIATEGEIKEILAENAFDATTGFIGPEGIKDVKIVADFSVKDLKNFVVGINETDYHLVGANFGEDITMPEEFVDVRLAKAGEGCPDCNGKLLITKGIEVGNIFQLGTKYSASMNATFTDVDGAEKPFIMGCYGIGITRTAAAAIERFHDEWGIIWPLAIAPYHVVITPVNVKDEQQMNIAQQIYEELKKQGVEVVLDDRDERAGVKFKDADLIGFPYRITVGKTISEGLVEFKARSGGEIEKISPEAAVSKIVDIIKNQ